MKTLGAASVPPPGTPAATQRRNDMIANLYFLAGDLRGLWIPSITDTVSTTDLSKNAHVATWDSTIAGKFTTVGSGVALTMDGTATEADVPDSSDHSFGDGAVDSAFTVFTLLNLTDATDSTVIAKWDVTGTLREWRVYFDDNDYPTVELYDESADTYIGREDATAWTSEGTMTALTMTYDGTGSNAGIRLYKNKTRVDDTDVSSGAYVAMENSTALVEIGQVTAGAPEFLDGKMALVGIAGKAFTEDEVAALMYMYNSYYDLSL